MKAAPPTRLSVEQLEPRLTPTWGVPWYSPTSLTLSFAPDGTDASGASNTLHSLLGPDTAAWERVILQAFQTWAIETNINIGLVSDDGSPLGTPGLAQGDPRFGDIRIAARPLSTSPGNLDLAGAIGFDPSGGTWSGDLLFNSLFPIGIGDSPTQYDLFTVALHEAGHSFGFGDTPNDPSSVLYPGYVVRTGLAPEDIAAIQSLYGARTPDAFEGASGDDTLGPAVNLTADGNLTAISADITTIGDTDVYQFTTPSTDTGINSLTVNLQAAGISLLTPKVTILDSNGNVVASAISTDPLNNNLSITLPNYSPSTTYYVKVEGSGTDVFSAGAYNLRLDYSQPYGNAFGIGTGYVNNEANSNGTNNTLATAETLGLSSETHAEAFAAVGALSNSSDVDWYQITPTSLTNFTGTLTVSVVPQDQDTSGAYATVDVFDATGNQLSAVVVTNEHGAFTVQLANQQPGATYYLRVSAANPGGTHATGGYALAADLSDTDVTTFNALSTGTLTADASTLYAPLSISQGKLVQYSLTATTAPGSADAAVGMTIVDSNGNVVFSMVAEAGQPMATGTVWLAAGTYTVVFTGGTRDGSPLPDLSFSAAGRERSDPMDPIFLDPIGTPPASPPPPLMTPPPASPPPASPPPPPSTSGWISIGTLATDPPPITIVDPIANPFLGLD